MQSIPWTHTRCPAIRFGSPETESWGSVEVTIHHHSWNWMMGNFTGKPWKTLYLMVNLPTGFRLRFSLQAIHWTIQSLGFHPFIYHSTPLGAWQVMVIHASLCGACAFKPRGSDIMRPFPKSLWTLETLIWFMRIYMDLLPFYEDLFHGFIYGNAFYWIYMDLWVVGDCYLECLHDVTSIGCHVGSFQLEAASRCFS